MTRPGTTGLRTRLRGAVRALRGTDPVPGLRKSLTKTQSELSGLRRDVAAAEAMQAELQRLAARVTELERDLDEQRSVSARVADLSDAVAHLLAVAAAGDAREVERAVREFADAL